jgi:hypothetical protein
MEQRLVGMQFTKGSGSLSVTSPPSAPIAPPGYYMLFVLDQNGVPSVAKVIRLSENPTNQPPVATITNPSSGTVSIQTGQSVTFAGSASDPDGSVTAYQWLFPGGSPAKSTVQNPGAVMFSTPGTYTASLTVLDNVGDNNVSPPTVTVVVAGSATLGAAITAPASGATVSGTTTVNMSATSVQGSPTSFVLRLDNSTIISSQSVSGATATAGWNTSGVANGNHTLDLTVTDGAGRSATASIPVTVNNSSATLGAAITAPASGATVSGTAAVNMSATNVQGSPTSFVLRLDNSTTISSQSVSGATATASWNTTGVANGNHTLDLTVTDGAGRSATASIPVTVNNTTGGGGGGDATPPTVAITSPASGVWTGNSIGITASATDNVGLVNIKLWGNGAVFATIPCSGTTCTGKVWWLTGPLPSAAYEVNAVASDAAGNQTVSATVTIFKNARTPVVPSGATTSGGGGGGGGTPPPLSASITSPAGGATVSGTTTVNMSATNVQGSPTSFVLQLDKSATISSQSVSGSTATASWDTTAVPNGSHTVDLTVTEGGGRTATASISVTVNNTTGGGGGGGGGGGADTTPPTVAVTSPPNGAWTGNSIGITVSGGDNVGLARLEAYGDGTLVGTLPCSGTSCTGSVRWLTGTLARGQHTITAVAVDTAGNQTTSAPIIINK